MTKCTMMDRTDFNFRIEVLSVLLKNVATNSNNGALYECADEWNQARVEILSDENHTQDAKEFLIDFFRTKVPDETCETWQIGRK